MADKAMHAGAVRSAAAHALVLTYPDTFVSLPYTLFIANLARRGAQVSYMILQRVSPVTHSIGNCLKRVIVIVASVIFFQNPMGRQNQIGAPPAWG